MHRAIKIGKSLAEQEKLVTFGISPTKPETNYVYIEIKQSNSKKYHDIKIFRGNKKNKIRRWQLCFKKYNIKIASMIDGDDLCFDYNLYKNNMFTKSILCCPKNIITGIFTNVLSFGTINKLSKNIKRDIDTEMIEPLIKKKKY